MRVYAYGGVQMPDGHFASVYASFQSIGNDGTGKGAVRMTGPEASRLAWFEPTRASTVPDGVLLVDNAGNSCILRAGAGAQGGAGWNCGASHVDLTPLVSGTVTVS